MNLNTDIDIYERDAMSTVNIWMLHSSPKAAEEVQSLPFVMDLF